MYDPDDDYDSDEEPEFLSSEEEMGFLSDQQHDTSLSPKAKQSMWGVIDKTKLAKVQARKGIQRTLMQQSMPCCVCSFVLSSYHCRTSPLQLSRAYLAAPVTQLGSF